MHNKLKMAEDKFMASIGTLAESFGLNKFIAQLYAVLYLSEKPLSLDELVERLGASKGNISLNIRELESWGAVKNVWVKGSRKDYYEADTDIKKVFANKLKSSVEKRIGWVAGMLNEFKEMVDSAEGELTEEEKKTVRVYKERTRTLEDFVSAYKIFFIDQVEYDEKAVEKYLKKPNSKDIIAKCKSALEALKAFDHQSIEDAYRKLADELKIKAAELIHPTRVAISGKTVGVGLFEMMELLGRDKVLKRMSKFC